MRKEKRNDKKRWYIAGIALGVILLGGMIFTGLLAWQKCSTTIVELQKQQMAITVDSVSASLEHELNSYKDDVNWLLDMAAYAQENRDREYVIYSYEQYLENRENYVSSVTLRDAGGTILWTNDEVLFTQTYDENSMGDGITLSERKGVDGSLYFVFCKQAGNGVQIELDVLIRGYYDDLISNIKIGSNGYLVLKTSGGTILMHPEAEQWGIEVINGRKELYHIEELQSLYNMTQKQLAGETGVAEYESYWWGHEDLPKVKKVSAYTPAYVGDDFFVVSAVIDYDDIYEPVFEGFTRIGITFLGMLVILIVFLGVFSYLALQKKKNQEEIEYLKDLNQVLEATRQSEEVISHQQRLQVMGTMTGGIAHEFNNMLTPIMGYADMLLDMLPSDSDEYEFVHEIFDASDRAKEVIQQISSLSRKNMETVFSFIPIKKLLNRTLKMVYSVCPVNIRISLVENFDKEGFLGNETQMKQVILNLCVNAFHAMGKEKEGILTIKGSVESRRGIEEFQQIQMANEWDTYLCICISDNGCGMSSETIEEVFTPFFTTKKTGKGTGLGLSVAEQIVHTHKGYICVKSQLGEGSDFYVYLPRTEEKQIDRQELERSKSLPMTQLTVLIVDDNEKILELLKKELGRLKIHVKTVETPDDARKALEEETYHLLLIDRTLGENHSGINFAMTIQNRYPDMITILMVDQVKKDVIEAVQQNIIDAYLEKPVSGAGIIEKVRETKSETSSVVELS